MSVRQETTPYVPSQDERTFACISHLTVFVSSIGLLIAIGLWIYLHTQRRYPYAAFQAGQAVFYQLIVMVLTLFLVGLSLMFFFGLFGLGLTTGPESGEVAFGAIIAIAIVIFIGLIAALTLVFYGYAIYAAVRSYQARKFRIPGISALADLISLMPDMDAERSQ